MKSKKFHQYIADVEGHDSIKVVNVLKVCGKDCSDIAKNFIDKKIPNLINAKHTLKNIKLVNLKNIPEQLQIIHTLDFSSKFCTFTWRLGFNFDWRKVPSQNLFLEVINFQWKKEDSIGGEKHEAVRSFLGLFEVQLSPIDPETIRNISNVPTSSKSLSSPAAPSKLQNSTSWSKKSKESDFSELELAEVDVEEDESFLQSKKKPKFSDIRSCTPKKLCRYRNVTFIEGLDDKKRIVLNEEGRFRSNNPTLLSCNAPREIVMINHFENPDQTELTDTQCAFASLVESKPSGGLQNRENQQKEEQETRKEDVEASLNDRKGFGREIYSAPLLLPGERIQYKFIVDNIVHKYGVPTKSAVNDDIDKKKKNSWFSAQRLKSTKTAKTKTTSVRGRFILTNYQLIFVPVCIPSPPPFLFSSFPLLYFYSSLPSLPSPPSY